MPIDRAQQREWRATIGPIEMERRLEQHVEEQALARERGIDRSMGLEL